MKFAPESQRARFPRLEAAAGEDPARFLDTGLEATPRIQGIQSEESLQNWEWVAHQLGTRQKILDELETRRQRLQSDEDTESESAEVAEDAHALVSDVQTMDDSEDVQAVLDDEVAREDTRTDVVAACNIRLDELEEDEPEPAREIPEVEYDSRDDPEYQEAYHDALSIAKAFGLQQCGERLEQERARDAPRPHVIDALETRQESLKPEAGKKEEVTA